MRSAHCALPSDRQRKIQPAIATFSAGEFHQQPALSDNTEKDEGDKVIEWFRVLDLEVPGSNPPLCHSIGFVSQ